MKAVWITLGCWAAAAAPTVGAALPLGAALAALGDVLAASAGVGGCDGDAASAWLLSAPGALSVGGPMGAGGAGDGLLVSMVASRPAPDDGRMGMAGRWRLVLGLGRRASATEAMAERSRKLDSSARGEPLVARAGGGEELLGVGTALLLAHGALGPPANAVSTPRLPRHAIVHGFVILHSTFPDSMYPCPCPCPCPCHMHVARMDAFIRAFRALPTPHARHHALNALLAELTASEWRAVQARTAAQPFHCDLVARLPLELVALIFAHVDVAHPYRLQRVRGPVAPCPRLPVHGPSRSPEHGSVS